MKVSELAEFLERDDLPMHIMLPSGRFVEKHFHITEVGCVQKDFIDCGGTRREHVACVLQIWTANDVEHRLTTGKLAKIMKMADRVLGTDFGDYPVEFEYGEDVISQYVLAKIEPTPKGPLLTLGGKHTECLAPDKCGVTGCC